MAGLKEIRRRLLSVRNTRKITYAMKLVSAAKLRKAQESVQESRKYTEAINSLLGEVLAEQSGSDLSHPLMQKHPEAQTGQKPVGVIVFGGSRGLCGGYNTNINRRVEAFVRENPGFSIDWLLLGRKPAEYFRRTARKHTRSFEELPEDANRWPIDEIAFEVENKFRKGEIHELYVISTRFRSAISMTVICEKVLPFEAKEIQASGHTASASGVTLFEPSAKQVFDALLPRILRTKLRQAALDAKASEHGSRMTAMDSATKNAGDLIDRLQLTHNKLRQERITKELLDIVGGAEALN